MSELVEVALAWLSIGVVPLPLRPQSKKAAIRWSNLRWHKPPPALVRRWFEPPDLNLGLLCGEASRGLVVLDFDRILEYWKWSHGNSLAATYTVETSRGRHVYLFLEDVPALTCAIEGGEVKASGYVVAPPSVHPGGHVYRALNPDARVIRCHDLGLAGVKVEEPLPTPILSGDWKPYGDSGEGLIGEIKQMLPIASYLYRITKIKPSSPDGTWLMARCPLHDDRNPSMWVNTRLGICRCFKPSCRGYERPLDVINLHSFLHDMSNVEAIFDLAARLGL